MKVLVDENLPPRLSLHLADLFPELHHVKELGLTGKPDSEIWRFAHINEYAAVFTADIDFQNKVLELGTPPRVLRIERCDFSAKEIIWLYVVRPFESRSFLHPAALC